MNNRKFFNKRSGFDAPRLRPISSIDFLTQVLSGMQSQIRTLEAEISRAAASPEKNDEITALHLNIRELSKKSTESISILQGISEESNPELYNSTNTLLDATGDTLHALRELVKLVQELERELKEGEFDYFSVVSDLLEQVHALLDTFTIYNQTEYVTLIKRRVEAIENALKKQVDAAIREIGCLTSSRVFEHEEGLVETANSEFSSPTSDSSHDSPNESPSSQLNRQLNSFNETDFSNDADCTSLDQIYLIIDAIGEKYRNDLLEKFSEIQFQSYSRLFGPSSKYYDLEYVDQRIAWCKFLMDLVEKKLDGIFPSRYQIRYPLLIEFCRRTRQHFSVLLPKKQEQYKDNTSQYITLVLKSLKTLVDFETEIVNQYGTEKERSGAYFSESIREVYDLYLGPYVMMEKKGLEDLMESLMKVDDNDANLIPLQPSSSSSQSSSNNPAKPVLLAPSVPVREPYESSRKIFEYIKASLKRCIQFSNGKTLLSLAKEFRSCLRKYAQLLKAKCPQPKATSSSSSSNTSPNSSLSITKQPVYALNKLSEYVLCRLITTGQYCIDTIPALESIIKQSIRPTLRSKVDFQNQIDIFLDVVSHSVTVLSLGQIQRMSKDWETFKSFNWTQVEQVQVETSIHIKRMLRVFIDCIPRIRASVSSAYFINICSKLATVYLDSFLDYVFMLRKVSHVGGGQLLMDLNEVKEFLLKMPNIKGKDEFEEIKIPKPYITLVNLKCKKIENILKVICAETNMVEETYNLLFPERDNQEYDTILIIKGLKRETPQTLEHMGKMLEDGSKFVSKPVGKINKIAQGSVGEITSSFSRMGGGFKAAFGEILGGNIFSESTSESNHGNSSHGKDSSNHGSTTSSASSSSSSSTASGVARTILNPFKKNPPTPPTPTSASASTSSSNSNISTPKRNSSKI